MVRHAIVAPVSLTTLAAVGVVSLAAFAGALLRTSVVPDVDLLLRTGAGAIGASLPIALPVGLLAGAAHGLSGLAADGGWQALRAVGVGGRYVARSVVSVASVIMLLWLALSHGVEPFARAAMRDAQVEAIARVHPRPGRTLRLGAWSVAVDDSGALHFAGGGSPPVIGRARAWELVQARGGVLARLKDGALRDGRGVEGTFAALEVPVPVGGSVRVHVSERSTAALLRVVRTPYERWILWKRTLLPLTSLPLALILLPLALSGRVHSGLLAAFLALGWWGAVRVLDGWVLRASTEPIVAASALFAGLALLVGAVWARWRDA